VSANITRRAALLGAGGYLVSHSACSRSALAARVPVVLQPRGDHVWTLAVSGSGRFAVSGHIDFSREGRGQRGGVIVWDLDARRAIGRYEASLPVSMVAFSPDEELLLVGGSRAAKVIRRAGGAVVREFPMSITTEAYAGVFSPDGDRVVLFESTFRGPDEPSEQWTKVWELRTGKVLVAFPRQAWAFARGATVAIDRKGLLWNVVTGRDDSANQLPRSSLWIVRALTTEGGLAFVSPISEERGAAGLWDPVRGGEVRRLTGHKGNVAAGAFTGDGKRVVTGSKSKSIFRKDCTVRVWDTSTTVELATLGSHEAGVRALGVSSAGQRVVSGDEGGGVLLWDVEL
jgi:WD40 repeat protein